MTTKDVIKHQTRQAKRENILAMLAEDPAQAQEHREKGKQYKKRARELTRAFLTKGQYEKAVRNMDTGARDYEDDI